MLQALLWLALSARAQSPAPYSAPTTPAPAPAAPAAPAVASTDTVQSSSGTAPVDLRPPEQAAPAASAPPPPPKPVKPIQVRIHPDAAHWEPFSLVASAEPEKASTHFTRRLKRHVTKKATAQAAGGEAAASVESDKPVVTYTGQSSRASAAARIHPAGGEDKLIIVSVYPKALAAQRRHLEVRFLIQEGYLEEVKVASVRVRPGVNLKLENEDSFTLRGKGADFSEEFPASAHVWVAAISTKPGSLQAGSVDRADFADKELKLTSFGWNVQAKRAKR